MKQALIQFWSERNTRERMIISIGSLLLLVSLLYAYVWLPIRNDVDRMNRSLPELRAAAAQMRGEANEISTLKTRGVTVPAGGALAAVEQSAASQGLRDKLEELGATDASHVRMSSNALPFDQWVSWLNLLQAQSGMRIESANVEATQDSGKVKAQAVLWAPQHP